MQCPNCYQQTEPGKFCTNCGALITENESAVTTESNATPEEDNELQVITQQHDDENSKKDEAAERLKTLTANFGHFFLTLVKNPSDAKKANANDLVSGIITIVIYSLLFALGYYLIVDSLLYSFMGNVGSLFGASSIKQSLPFTNGFLWPFLKFVVLFAIIIAITFAGLKLTASKYSFQTTVAKYGGYLLPFLLLLVAGYILLLISLYSIGVVAISVSVSGTIFIIPTLIMLERPALGVDRVYLLIVTYILNILATSLILQSILASVLQLINPMNGMFGQ